MLREELEARGMSANALAMRLGVPAGRITEIIHEKRAVTPDTAIRLAEFFGGEPRFWINIRPPTIYPRSRPSRGTDQRPST